MQSVVAIRDIEPGSELTLCYLGEQDRFSVVGHRRNILKNYGFICVCEICKAEENLDEEPFYLKHSLRIKKALDSPEKMDAVYWEKEKILEENGSKIIWRILNLKAAMQHVDCCSEVYKLILTKHRQLEELLKISSLL